MSPTGVAGQSSSLQCTLEATIDRVNKKNTSASYLKRETDTFLKGNCLNNPLYVQGASGIGVDIAENNGGNCHVDGSRSDVVNAQTIAGDRHMGVALNTTNTQG